MNLYAMLRLMVRKLSLNEAQLADCLATIDEAESLNVLGSSVQRMNVVDHVCVYPRGSEVCDKCGKSWNQ